MYGQYSRAVSNQERAIMARVRYINMQCTAIAKRGKLDIAFSFLLWGNFCTNDFSTKRTIGTEGGGNFGRSVNPISIREAPPSRIFGSSYDPLGCKAIKKLDNNTSSCDFYCLGIYYIVHMICFVRLLHLQYKITIRLNI